MNIKDKLQILINNENATRQTGKTTALKELCKKIDGIFVNHSSFLIKENGGTVFSKTKLIGTTCPIVLDNHAQYLVYVEALNRIQYLELKLRKIKSILDND